MPTIMPPKRDTVADHTAEANLSMAYWSPPVVPVPHMRQLNGMEAIYAYFGSDLE